MSARVASLIIRVHPSTEGASGIRAADPLGLLNVVFIAFIDHGSFGNVGSYVQGSIATLRASSNDSSRHCAPTALMTL
jgi:hypothetical protein